jgi:hypothetical protein
VTADRRIIPSVWATSCPFGTSATASHITAGILSTAPIVHSKQHVDVFGQGVTSSTKGHHRPLWLLASRRYSG